MSFGGLVCKICYHIEIDTKPMGAFSANRTEIQKKYQDFSRFLCSQRNLLDFVRVGSADQTGVLRIYVQTSEKKAAKLR